MHRLAGKNKVRARPHCLQRGAGTTTAEQPPNPKQKKKKNPTHQPPSKSQHIRELREMLPGRRKCLKELKRGDERVIKSTPDERKDASRVNKRGETKRHSLLRSGRRQLQTVVTECQVWTPGRKLPGPHWMGSCEAYKRRVRKLHLVFKQSL